jgi:hypothetical protein
MAVGRPGLAAEHVRTGIGVMDRAESR